MPADNFLWAQDSITLNWSPTHNIVEQVENYFIFTIQLLD